jgi:hypothetical protein
MIPAMADRLGDRTADPPVATSAAAARGPAARRIPRLLMMLLVPLVAAVTVSGCMSTVSGSPSGAPVTVTETVSVTVTVPGAGSETPGADPVESSSEAPIRTASLASPDPCSLLTQDEADQLAGRPLQTPVSSGPEGEPTMCQFTSDPNEPGVAQVTVQVGDGVKKYLDIDKDTLGHAFAQIDGLGDEAWQEENAIFVRQGELWIGITLVLLNDPAENVEPLQAAAAIAVGRT